MITEIYRLAVTTDGVDAARLISEWRERETLPRAGDFIDFQGGEAAAPIVYEPL